MRLVATVLLIYKARWVCQSLSAYCPGAGLLPQSAEQQRPAVQYITIACCVVFLAWQAASAQLR